MVPDQSKTDLVKSRYDIVRQDTEAFHKVRWIYQVHIKSEA